MIISSIFQNKNMDRRWSDSSVGEVFPCKHGDLSAIIRTQALSYMLVIPALGRKRQADPWGSLASQHGTLGELQASETLCLKTQSGWCLWNGTQRCPLASTCMHRNGRVILGTLQPGRRSDYRPLSPMPQLLVSLLVQGGSSLRSDCLL